MKTTKKLLTTVTTGIINKGDLTLETYPMYIESLFVAVSTIQDNIQVILEFALDHFSLNNSNNPDVFNFLMKCAMSKYGKGIRTATLQNYIEALISGMVLTKTANGAVFKKRTNKTKVQVNSALLAEKWYMFDKENTAVPRLDIMKRCANAIADYLKVQAGDKDAEIVNEQESNTFVQELNALLAKHDPALAKELGIEQGVQPVPVSKEQQAKLDEVQEMKANIAKSLAKAKTSALAKQAQAEAKAEAVAA